jgi:hypothetical protein
MGFANVRSPGQDASGLLLHWVVYLGERANGGGGRRGGGGRKGREDKIGAWLRSSETGMDGWTVFLDKAACPSKSEFAPRT